ncbi:kinase-like domain-containing protein [Gamsiella multidivaricata]|uniref:kinase-like domain-containing protein n=1 Tax=Gamsiella multidivaricata TaxID=101098 RepID=UPI0022200A7A|nr:kinase-like domain-containing protein [Gamsiella multidivaricata]KAG0353564.1 hypothetical protein BGZ54_002190 [Gamsiella multidivaricata]KAI7822881.1 kinase-like domain-containing protein [Gamsiella multidivaricata]
MGNPLSKCCAQDTTVPEDNVATTDPGASTSALVDGQGSVESSPPVASYAPVKDNNAATSSNDTNTNTNTTTNNKSSFFKSISGRLSSLGQTLVGPKSRSIEQGFKTLPFPLTEDEKRILLANEIPSVEIKKLSIGVDAGGMGIIHVAEWKGQKVAIKEAATHVEIYSRMKGCDGVVQFYGVTFPPGLNKMCIVTKYADKGSLTWHLKVEYQNLTWDDKLRLATQISSGIARLHQEGIYHRDLHGGNILIDDQGNAMLTDFGASTIMEERVVRNIKRYALEEVPAVEGRSKFISKKITGLDGQDDGAKKSGTVKKDDDDQDDPLIGVMAYIAPERFRNPKFFDAKCDIYSLGVLMWELTSGHSAFAKVPQDVHLAVAIMNGKRELSVDGTPTEYKALYEKCWHSDPAQRPSLDEILKTLAKVRASMTPEQLAVTRTRNNTHYESVEVYEESLSIPRPTSDIQQHFVSE